MRRPYAMVLGYFLIAGAVGLALLNFAEQDRHFVVYRFASNLAAGKGLLYQLSGSEVSMFPLGPVLLALFSRAFDMSLSGWAISLIALTVSALFLARLMDGQWLAGLIFIGGACIAPSPVVLVMVACGLAALDAIRYRQWILAGILMAAAILCDPLGIALALIAVILILRAERWQAVFRYAVPTIIISALVFGALWISLKPSRLVAINPGIFCAALLMVAIISVTFAVFRRQLPTISPSAGALVAWSALAGLTALGSGNAPSAALLPGAIVLALSFPWRQWGGVLAILAVIINGGLRIATAPAGTFINQTAPPPALTIGQWLAARTDPGALIATDEIGVLGYYALQRPIIDMGGVLQSNPLDAFFMARHAPDVIVLRDGVNIPWAGFATSYAKMTSVGNLSVYFRVVNWSAFADHGVDVNFSAKLGREDIRLVNVGLGNTLRPGDLVRVRLDWVIAYPLRFPLDLKLDLLPYNGPGASVQETIPASVLTPGTVSTYHILSLPKDAAEGRIRLFINLGARGGTYGVLQVAEVDVRK